MYASQFDIVHGLQNYKVPISVNRNYYTNFIKA